MASYTWSGSTGGNWSDPTNWTPTGVPGSADAALVNLAGSYAIALDVASIGSLTLDAPGVTVTPSTALTLGGVLDVQAGTFTVSNTITGGTIKPDGGTINYAGGTLDGVTLTGPLDLSASDATLTIIDGISFTGANPEQILDTGPGAHLQFGDTETLANVAIVTGNTSFLFVGPALTLAANSTLTTDGLADIGGTSLDNKGIITSATGLLSDSADTTNEGSIFISNTNIGNYFGDLTNTGTISVGEGSKLTIDGNLDNAYGTINLTSSSTLNLDTTETYSGLGTIARNGASVTLSGALDLTGQTLDVTAGSLFDGSELFDFTITGGTIKQDGGILDISNLNLDGVILDAPLKLTTERAEINITDGTFTDTGHPQQIVDTGAFASLSINDAETLNDVAITLGSPQFSTLYGSALTLSANSTLTTQGQAAIGGNLDNKGSIISEVGYFEDGAKTVNEGSIIIRNGLANSNYGGNGIDALTNTGTLVVSGNGTTVYVSGLDNSGAINVGNGATLITNGSISALGTITFLDDAGTLSLDNSSGSDSGTLQLFQNGDTIDLTGTGYSLDHIGNTLTIGQGGSVADSFALTGEDYSDATFTLTADANETILTTDAPCFCAGTMILTDRGEHAVESLEVGDWVITLRDGIEKSMPIRWVGHRRVVVARHPEPEHVDPIRIGRDAIAPGVPKRDLHVSPDHALHLDGMLIQARQLVNDMTITRDTGRTVVTYHHVELDRHAILIADGMPCESYLDGGNRGQFDGQGTVVPLHPPVTGDGQPCALLATDAARVQPVWQRLAERAQAAGHVAPAPVLEPELLPWLETADGTRLLPCGDGLRFALPPGCTRVRLRSPSDRPTALAPWSDDRRRLGVAVRGLVLCQGRWRQEIALDQPSDGWWPVERAGEFGWRWTDGDGHVELPEAAEAIEITLHATMPVRVRPSRTAAA